VNLEPVGWTGLVVLTQMVMGGVVPMVFGSSIHLAQPIAIQMMDLNGVTATVTDMAITKRGPILMLVLI
jgi:hypothetical protein